MLASLNRSPLAAALRPVWRRILAIRRNQKENRRTRAEFAVITDEDRRRTAFYSQFIKSGDLVFDVGANRGNRSKAFLALGARVIAFEPQDQCAGYLEIALGGNRRFTLVRSALGSAEGEAEMMISSVDVLSSLSTRWIEATKESGRFTSIDWANKAVVPVTTLDLIIRKYGEPAFVKIDVEGFELEVLQGLSRPVSAISIEYTGERIQDTLTAIDYASELGEIEGQLSIGESMEFLLPTWQRRERLAQSLRELVAEHRLANGDVYLRLARSVHH